jgi:hypothetical protein
MNLTLTEWLLIGIFITVFIASIFIVIHQVETFNRLGGMWFELQYFRNDVNRFKAELNLDGYANINGIYTQLNELNYLKDICDESLQIALDIKKIKTEVESMNSSISSLYKIENDIEQLQKTVHEFFIYEKFDKRQ